MSYKQYSHLLNMSPPVCSVMEFVVQDFERPDYFNDHKRFVA